MATITPNRSHGIINRETNGMFTYHGWPSVCIDGDGVLYAVCSGGRCLHVCPFGKTYLWISRDEGKTWSAPIVVNDTPLDDRDAGILWLGEKKVLVTWFIHPAHVYINDYTDWMQRESSAEEAPVVLGTLATWKQYADQPQLGGSFIRRSDDGGLTWSDIIRIPVSSPHGPCRLKDGRLLYVGKEMYSDEEKPGAVAVYESTDTGYTWTRIGELDIPEGFVPGNFHEPHAIELDNGEIFCTIRVEGHAEAQFTVFTSRSTDGGKTWSAMVPTGFVGSPPHLLQHSSGALICVFGRRCAPFGQRAAVSYDRGETWTDEYVLRDDAPDGDLGYPCSVELPSGEIFTVYYQKYQPDEKPSLLFTRWSLEKQA
ncbi:MAG: exo-alpha-sialidase [Clostridia bacterium]|nr:exo-alpha-sialidase [Clostridia bacterium]